MLKRAYTRIHDTWIQRMSSRIDRKLRQQQYTNIILEYNISTLSVFIKLIENKNKLN